MKTLTHVVLPIAILMGIVGVVAYMTQNTRRTKTPPNVPVLPGAQGSAEPIMFDEPFQSENPPPRMVESQSNNHQDFWFHVAQEKPVRMVLTYQNCNCTEVQLGTFDVSDGEWAEMAKETDGGKPVLSLASLCKLSGSVNFRTIPSTLKNDEPPLELPGTPPNRAAKPYLLRVTWHAKHKPFEYTDPEKIEVALNAETKDSGAPRQYSKMFYFMVVPGAIFWPVTVECGEFGVGGRVQRECIVWSATRDRLAFTTRLTGPIDPKSSEPCAEITEPVALNAEELAQLPSVMPKDFAKLRPRCAYRFNLTIHERKGMHQLELGRLSRPLVISFFTEHGQPGLADITPGVVGLIRGEVNLADERGRISLGDYKTGRGKTVTALLTARDKNVELEDPVSSDGEVKARFVGPPTFNNGQKEWTLEVSIEPNARFLGELPPDTLITVTTKSANPRRLRIPVSGKPER